MGKGIRLGLVPVEMTLVLTRDTDFVSALVSEDGDWPAGSSITIKVGTQSWPATVVGADASWSIPEGQVNAVIDQKPRRFQLVYGEGTAGFVWGAGQVEVARA